jgi:lipid-binding SYLF domain-containing protein
MKPKITILFSTVLLVFLLGALSSNAYARDSASGKRAKIDSMAKKTLDKLLRERPEARSLYDKCYGYAVFGATKVAYIYATGGGGRGEAVVRSSGKKIYMDMATAGAGLGLGAQRTEIVFLFEDKKTFDSFVDKGLEAGIGLSAAAGTEGANARATFRNGVAVFQFTKAGLLLGADLSGTKFWKNEELN